MSPLAFFAHANVFHHGGQPVPIELSIASIPEDGTEPKVICITVDHSNLLTTDKDRRANRYINERLSLKSHLPRSVPLEYLDFCVRGKFCHLAQGNRGLIVVKGSDQRKIFEKLGLFTINLEILPHFRDLNDRSLPDHLHDEVHEDFNISECTMVKSYRFARYLQHFNKLQAECKRQTAHLVDGNNTGALEIPQHGAVSPIPGPTLSDIRYWHQKRRRKWKHAMKNLMGSNVPLADGCTNSFGGSNQKEGRNERKEKGE
ncbi:uncharacterized protein TNCV_1392441 [Trichonephila clavipes]|nr:uncharacterized protein TNCV_1392441 [Trichonephila clavipes]